jgi:hypothetical protein
LGLWTLNVNENTPLATKVKTNIDEYLSSIDYAFDELMMGGRNKRNKRKTKKRMRKLQRNRSKKRTNKRRTNKRRRPKRRKSAKK